MVKPGGLLYTAFSRKSAHAKAKKDYGGGQGISERRANISFVSLQVIPFAADCDQDECTCRDPAAEENQ